ncbi:hypothetical protein QBC46DRAFT_378981 [Diplogelasinospora grovesii]|uniref:FAD-binding domain-containing protein n=1 Tax=Diplogelasinospora grovesii TaxID=303347 RepID=A0AAN6NBS9_9PEZI|nr:hypothetical protein QBC46DRAFT_378981 [Diplogelasinospora grovesii]
MTKHDFRVIISGGGVAGLTLASCLEQAGVDYVLLERRGELAPQLGASIVIFPNGARILEQLGCYQGLKDYAQPTKWSYNHDSKGRPIGPPTNANALATARFGYSVACGERQRLLKVLADNIKDKSKCLVNKEVAAIEQTSDSVTVKCADGSAYSGDLLIGADGVFSRTREQMWALAEPEFPDLVASDKRALKAEYNVFYGIADGVTQLVRGDMDTCFHPGRYAMTLTSIDDNRVYYCVEERLPKSYGLGEIPRYSAEDTEAFMRRNGDIRVRPDLTIGDLWRKTIFSKMAVAEEGKFKLWTYGRIACVGDSVHKTTLNLGAGGNAAIESAAAMANNIVHLLHMLHGKKPTANQVREIMVRYHESRRVRADAVCDSSWQLTRLNNMHGPFDKFFVRFLLPHAGEFIVDQVGDMMIGATKLDYLPLPKRSLTGTKPFNPTQGDGQKESKIMRALWGLPMLGLAVVAFNLMFAEDPLPAAKAILDTGKIVWATGSVPIQYTFYRIGWLDELLAALNMFFTPSVYDYDALSRSQVFSFLTDAGVVIMVWYLESVRRANHLTILQLPMMFALVAQLFGAGVICPLYCFLHYILSPIENFSGTDNRLTKMKYTLAILPAVILGHYIPAYGMFLWPDLADRQKWIFVWQLYPVYVSLALQLLTRSGLFPDTMDEDKVHAPNRDLPVIRTYVGSTVALSAAVWLYTWYTNGLGTWTVFIPTSIPSVIGGITGFTSQFLRWDQVFTFGGQFVWLLYLFGDIKTAGMADDVSWFKMVLSGAVSLVALGPGATLGLGWLWREGILATRRHKDALTLESVKRLGFTVMDD